MKQDTLMSAMLQVMSNAKVPLSNAEMGKRISNLLDIDTTEMVSRSARDKRNDFEYKLAWIRTRANDLGLIRRIGRGVWEITDVGKKSLEV